MSDTDHLASTASLEHRAASLKERIYLTFTSLAVVLALEAHGTLSAGSAAVTLVITVVGTLLAVFVADFLSHLTVKTRMPSRTELGEMVRVSVESIGVIVLPMVFLGAAGLGWWSVTAGLQASIVVLLVTLLVIGFLAVFHLTLAFWLKAMVLLGELVLGGIVIALKFLSHT